MIGFPINGLKFRDITTGGELGVEPKVEEKKKEERGKRDPDIKMS